LKGAHKPHLRDLVWAQAPYIYVAQPGEARVETLKSAESIQKGGLPSTIWTDEPEDLTPPKTQINPIYGLYPAKMNPDTARDELGRCA
jgi:hypothetical protein